MIDGSAREKKKIMLFFSFFRAVLDIMVSWDLLHRCLVGTDTYTLTVKHGGNM